MKVKTLSLVASLLLGVGGAVGLVLVGMLAWPAAAGAQTEGAGLTLITGTVTDLNSRPLATVPVLANSYLDIAVRPPVSVTMTDAQGVYTLSVPPGVYRVHTCAACSGRNYVDVYYSNVLEFGRAAPVTVTLGATGGINFALDVGGTLTGWVMDATTGQPVTSGVRIRATPLGGTPWERLVDHVEATGAYTMTGLPPGVYQVSAEAPGYYLQVFKNQVDFSLAWPVTVTRQALTPDINFALLPQPPGAIFGVVHLPEGAPAPLAGVDAFLLPERTLHVGAGADPTGAFRLGGLVTGTWAVRATPPVAAEFRGFSASPEVIVSLAAVAPFTLTQPLTLTRVSVLGRAVLPLGQPAPGSGVHVFNDAHTVERGEAAGPDGYFALGGLPEGAYHLELFPPFNAPGLVPPPPVSFVITSTLVPVNLGDIAFQLAPKHIAVSVVRSGSGAGVAGADVTANLLGAGGRVFAQTDALGQAGLDVGPGAWEVMIHTDPLGPYDWLYSGVAQPVFFTGTVAETAHLTFTVDAAGAWVTGQVVAPDGSPLEPRAIGVDLRAPNGVGNHVPLQANGFFTVPVQPGTYNMWIFVDETFYPAWTGPTLPPITVTDTQNVGVLRLVAKDAAIRGRVSLDPGGAGVPNLRVQAWKEDGGWAAAQTQGDGSYSMPVVSGTWHVAVNLPYTSTLLFLGPPPPPAQVTDTVHTVINFTLAEAGGTLAGQVVGADGALLPAVRGWAYARPAGSPKPIAAAPLQNGLFTLNVPHGTYQVGVWLPPDSNYTLAGEAQLGPLALADESAAAAALADLAQTEQLATVDAAATPVPVTLTLLLNDAHVKGCFTAAGQPAVRLEGEVFATAGQGGAWQATRLLPATGCYDLRLAAGTWNLGYHLESAGYVNNPPPDTRLTLAAGQSMTFDFSLVAANATILGQLLQPGGAPLDKPAWAWAHSNRTATSAALDTGTPTLPPFSQFRLAVPAGRFVVGAHAPEGYGYIQPDVQVVTATATYTPHVTLQFKPANAALTGTVWLHGQAGNPVYGDAWVWAWSETGQHTGAPINAQGLYRLNVLTGAVWHVGAVYRPEGGSLFYETVTPTVISLTAPAAHADLELFLAGTALPPAISDTFDPSVGWTGVLSDGTRIEIPAGAMPTTDTVRIAITPLVDELPRTLTSRPLGYGYAIAAYDDATGSQIVSNFNTDVNITLYYAEADLRQKNFNVKDLVPAYFSTTTNAWTLVDSFTVDTAARRITAQINHFSRWTLSSVQTATDTSNPSVVYLPLATR